MSDTGGGGCCLGGGSLEVPNGLLVKPSVVKIVLLGNAGVGKTTLINAMSQAGDSLTPSCALDMMTASIHVNIRGVDCNIWDTAGQEKFRSIAPIYLRGASICVVTYALDDSKSSDDVSMWEDLAEKQAPGSRKLLVATKSDLAVLRPREQDDRLPDVVTSCTNMNSIKELYDAIGDLASQVTGHYTL